MHELSNQIDFEAHLSFLENGDVTADYNDLCLSSVFQPIVDSERTIFGFEALSRLCDLSGAAISPGRIFAHESDETLVGHQRNLDRLSRVVHIRNFSHYHVEDAALFVNILPVSAVSVLESEVNLQLLFRRLDAIGVNPERVILEVVEHGADVDQSLATATAQHLSSRFQIAIDDFGIDASQEERVRAIGPNILKIDRSLLERYVGGETGQLLRSLELADEVGATTLVEGVESEGEFQAMTDLGIDLFQGYHLGRPEHLSTYCSKKT